MTKPKSKFTAFRAEPELAQAMARLQQRDGISTSEQIRRGLKMFLAKKGVYDNTTITTKKGRTR